MPRDFEPSLHFFKSHLQSSFLSFYPSSLEIHYPTFPASLLPLLLSKLVPDHAAAYLLQESITNFMFTKTVPIQTIVMLVSLVDCYSPVHLSVPALVPPLTSVK